jgi:hypothetical protein
MTRSDPPRAGVSVEPEAGAPDNAEIEVTPEMLECGYQVLRASGITDDPMEADKLLVERIYRAMFSSRPRGVMRTQKQ